jgi:hypothetical protein
VFGNEQKNKSGKTMPVKDTIQSRRGSSAQWSAANPILADGEIGYDSTTRRMKIGDGVTAWNALAYSIPETTLSGSNWDVGPSSGLRFKVVGNQDVILSGLFGLCSFRGATGAWFSGCQFRGNNESILGYFGASGNASTLTKLFLGTSDIDTIADFYVTHATFPNKTTVFNGPLYASGNFVARSPDANTIQLQIGDFVKAAVYSDRVESFVPINAFTVHLGNGVSDCRLFRFAGDFYLESDATFYFRDTSSSATLASLTNSGVFSATINTTPITKSALLALTPSAAAGEYRITNSTPAQRRAYPDGTNWRYSDDSTIVV